MTARVCAVHGEYSATGVCRWCEPLPESVAASDAALRGLCGYGWMRGPLIDAYLLFQHAALRWERVARRWAAKGQTPRTHRETVDGDVAFDDHCVQCLREGRRVPP